jgi:RNA polymerase primary sigma factor
MQTTAMNEAQRIEKIKEYQKTGCLEAKLSIIENYYSYVLKLAIKCNRTRCETHLKDLISEGVIGLMIALERFDPDRGLTFLTYAHSWISLKIQKFNKLNYSPITIPIGMLDKIEKLKGHCNDFTAKHQRNPTIGELAKIAGQPRNKVALLMDQTKDYISLNAKKWDAASIVDQGVDTPSEQAVKNEMDSDLECALAQLPEIERKVICGRFGIDEEDGRAKTLVEIGEELGVSYEWVRLLEKKAMKKLEKHLTNA